MDGFRIGELSRLAGIATGTIRFYERIGLLPSPPRTASGYRKYPVAALEHLRTVLNIKDLGFTLEEIAELMTLPQRHQNPCREVLCRAGDKLKELESRIAELQHTKTRLQYLMHGCDADARKCLLFETVAPLVRFGAVSGAAEHE